MKKQQKQKAKKKQVKELPQPTFEDGIRSIAFQVLSCISDKMIVQYMIDYTTADIGFLKQDINEYKREKMIDHIPMYKKELKKENEKLVALNKLLKMYP